MHLLKKAALAIVLYVNRLQCLAQKIKSKNKLSFLTLLSLLLMLFAAETAAAKSNARDGIITGKITDKKTGLPVPGVTISIPDLKISTSTGNNGLYQLNQLPNGEYLVAGKRDRLCQCNQSG